MLLLRSRFGGTPIVEQAVTVLSFRWARCSCLGPGSAAFSCLVLRRDVKAPTLMMTMMSVPRPGYCRVTRFHLRDERGNLQRGQDEEDAKEGKEHDAQLLHVARLEIELLGLSLDRCRIWGSSRIHVAWPRGLSDSKAGINP